MPKDEKTGAAADWDLGTWEGARRETLRRWAALPLERIVAALEEMQGLGETLSKAGALSTGPPPEETGSAVHEQKKDEEH